MARRKFKRDEQEYVYRLFLSDARPGVRDGLQSAYQRGLVGHRAAYVRTSLTYAAWAAGRDSRKAKARKAA